MSLDTILKETLSQELSRFWVKIAQIKNYNYLPHTRNAYDIK